MSTKFSHAVETIGPKQAKEILEHPATKALINRTIRAQRVLQYAEMMKAGDWKLNGSTIGFSQNGALVDGQHRLHGVIEANVPVKFLVIRGLDDEDLNTIDTGSSRQVADYLRMHGLAEGYNIVVQSAIGIIRKFSNGEYRETKNDKLFPQEAIDFLKKHPSFMACVKRDGFMAPSTGKTIAPASMLVALYWLFRKIDSAKTEEFFDKLITGTKLGAKSPILQLRSQLMTLNSGQRRKGKVYRRPVLYYIITAFMAFLEGRNVDAAFKYTTAAKVILPKRRGGG